MAICEIGGWELTRAPPGQRNACRLGILVLRHRPHVGLLFSRPNFRVFPIELKLMLPGADDNLGNNPR